MHSALLWKLGEHCGNAPAKLGQASNRSIVDLHDGMGRWNEDGQVDLWQYPKNCDEPTSSGYSLHLWWHLAGSRLSIRKASLSRKQATAQLVLLGDSTTAMFRAPDDVQLTNMAGYTSQTP